MARPIESQLYRALVESCFNFVRRGNVEIKEIYELVQHEFPNLCDDEYPCLHQKSRSLPQSEWKHIVRSALQRCKITYDAVNFSGKRGYWIFS